MSDSLWTQTLSSFRDATASAEPTPGGGSVAMVSASLGLGLVIMALEITAKKPEPGSEAKLGDLLREARELLAQLSHFADQDVAVFQAYMAALKMPKATDEEKSKRKGAMDAALIKATTAPLEAARACLRALDIAERAAELSSVRVISDVGAGASLLQGAVSAVLLNVDINLPGIKQADAATGWAMERAGLEESAANRASSVMAKVRERIRSGK
jgi:formiminotetrahydrofolate cyclodeaminase